MRQIAVHHGNRSSLLKDYSSLLGNALLRHRAGLAERARRVEAERATQVTAQFIANMSHELRTPLNAIIGFSKILQDIDKLDINNEKVKEYSHVIQDTADQLLAIINEILDISKIQSGKLEIEKQQVLISEVLQSCLTLLTITADNKKLSLINKIDPDLPPVMGDPVKLKQIFTNILSNAVKFTPNLGSIIVTASHPNIHQLIVNVTDTGIGMTADEITDALIPFGQVESDLSRQFEGTGLGLPIAKALIELHDGNLTVSSVKGIGTEITISLPLEPEHQNTNTEN